MLATNRFLKKNKKRKLLIVLKFGAIFRRLVKTKTLEKSRKILKLH